MKISCRVQTSNDLCSLNTSSYAQERPFNYYRIFAQLNLLSLTFDPYLKPRSTFVHHMKLHCIKAAAEIDACTLFHFISDDENIRGKPEALYVRRFLRAYFSEPIRADYSPLPTDPIGWYVCAARVEIYKITGLRVYPY